MVFEQAQKRMNRKFEEYWKAVEGNFDGIEYKRIRNFCKDAFEQGFSDGKIHEFEEATHFDDPLNASIIGE